MSAAHAVDLAGLAGELDNTPAPQSAAELGCPSQRVPPSLRIGAPLLSDPRKGEDRRLIVISWRAFLGLLGAAEDLAQRNESRPRRLLRYRKRRGDKNRRQPGSRA
jgi:hypothetical protein